VKITIDDAGNVGRGIGTRVIAGGHEVEIVDRDPAGAEKLAAELALLPQGTPVVKAFDTTFGGTLVAGEVAGQKLDVLIAGDDDDAKQKVAQLVSDGGLRPLDAGPLVRAQQLEQVGFLHISLQQPYELGFASAIRLHP
jgi:predicted dinucleotide-binding enzyme